jgi:hypothetical protein
MLERLSDYARDDKSTATGRAVGIIEALFDAGNDIIKADDAPSSLLSFDDETRVYFVVRNLLRRTPAAERVAVLTRVVRSAVFERPDVEHARDVLALDLYGGPASAKKSTNGIGMLSNRGQKELDGQFLVELHVRPSKGEARTVGPCSCTAAPADPSSHNAIRLSGGRFSAGR